MHRSRLFPPPDISMMNPLTVKSKQDSNNDRNTAETIAWETSLSARTLSSAPSAMAAEAEIPIPMAIPTEVTSMYTGLAIVRADSMSGPRPEHHMASTKSWTCSTRKAKNSGTDMVRTALRGFPRRMSTSFLPILSDMKPNIMFRYLLPSLDDKPASYQFNVLRVKQ